MSLQICIMTAERARRGWLLADDAPNIARVDETAISGLGLMSSRSERAISSRWLLQLRPKPFFLDILMFRPDCVELLGHVRPAEIPAAYERLGLALLNELKHCKDPRCNRHCDACEPIRKAGAWRAAGYALAAIRSFVSARATDKAWPGDRTLSLGLSSSAPH